MKNIVTLFALVILLLGCKDEYIEEFIANKPIYMSYEDLRSAVKGNDARPLENPGKIYFKDNYIFIIEEFQGVHIIDNRNPANPLNIAFIEIPGSVDIAIKGDILYADSYVDLVAIDISDLGNPVEVNRIEDVFPYTLPPYNEDYRLAEVDEQKGVVIGWGIGRVKQEMEYHYYPVYRRWTEDLLVYADAKGNAGGTSGEATFGVGGSMARFGLYEKYLYVVDQSQLTIFDVQQPDQPQNIGKQYVGWNVETLFLYDKHMFLGTQNGMQVYSLQVPTVPEYVSSFWHVTSCDPVVIADGYAYITLRGGTSCGSNVNRLDVLQLAADYVDNTLIASYPLNGPYGLGIDGEVLFVCDGDAGLKVYDVTDRTDIDNNMIAHFPAINAYDVIPVNGYLFMIGDDGFYLYDYSDLQNIRLMGTIPIIK